ncbi:hypothetical protein MC885_013981 [Smutsia gigantea]|nr:hypothetical protein MC885_013981 [Smutsia gigantea]
MGPPGHRDEPYLTEAGRDAFDKFWRLRQGELQVLGGGLLQAPQPVLVKEHELVKDALNVLIGVVSATFSLCQGGKVGISFVASCFLVLELPVCVPQCGASSCGGSLSSAMAGWVCGGRGHGTILGSGHLVSPAQAFVVKQGVHVSGASPESISGLLSEVAECGTHYARLSHFSLQPVLDSSCSKGLVFQAFTSGLRRYLQYYRACVLSTPPTLSLLTIGFLFKKLGRQLR